MLNWLARYLKPSCRGPGRNQMLKNLILHFFVLVSLILPKAYAAEGYNQQQRFIEDAKKEAKMVFYTSVETEFARALTSGLEAKYPFIKTDILRSTDAKVRRRT